MGSGAPGADNAIADWLGAAREEGVVWEELVARFTDDDEARARLSREVAARGATDGAGRDIADEVARRVRAVLAEPT